MKTQLCPECGTEVIVKGKTTLHYEVADMKKNALYHNIPFYCEVCGAIKFPIKTHLDYVFIWPIWEKAVKQETLIYLPEVADELSPYGIVLSHGPGYHDLKKKKFFPVHDLEVGTMVLYDKTIPWNFVIDGQDKIAHEVKYCAFVDVKAVVENDGKDGMEF